jgi:L-aminopeptidase/D-esterase-like protein
MTARPGPLNLITDIGGLSVGHAHDPLATTGVSVILPDQRAVASVAVAGGGPGTRETDALAPDTLVDAVDAIVLSGGSVYGLAAADGVAAVLGARRRGYALTQREDTPVSPIVPAAILFDLANGGRKGWGETPPYRALGMEALRACSRQPALGRVGAGYGARAGQVPGGMGSASVITADGLAVGALAAVNSHGAVRMPGTDVFWAWPYEQDCEFGGARPAADLSFDLEDWGEAKSRPGLLSSHVPASEGRTNTTLGCIGVNVALTPAEAQRVAKMALAGVARAIRPAFAPFDGDVVFCLSTGQIEVDSPRPFLLTRLGELAASSLARAIARGVYAARSDTC